MPILVDVEARPDRGSFKRTADTIDRTFAAAGREASASFSKGFAAGSKEITQAANDYRKVYDQITTAADRAKTAETERQRLQERAKSQAREVAAAEESVAKAKRESGKGSQEVVAAERQLERVRDQLAQTNTRIVRTAGALAKSERDQARYTREAIAAYRELEEAKRRAASESGFGRAFTQGGANLASGMISQTGGVVGQFASLGKGAGGAFVAGAAAAIVAGGFVKAAETTARAAVGVMQDVFNKGLNLERTFNKLQGVTRSNPRDMAQFRDAARALGSDLTLPGVSSKKAAEAMLELSKGGLDKDQVLSSVRGTLMLSSAAEISPTEAAASQASILQSFGLNANQADHVADLLTAAQQVAPGEIPDFMLALQQAGTVAKGFGISVEDTTATLAMMFKSGIVGSDAGTSFKTMMTHLANPSDPAQGAMDELGLQIHDATGNFVGMRSLIQQLQAAGKRMRPDQFQRDVAELFGTDAIRGAMIAKDDGSLRTWDQARAEFTRGGQAQEMAAANMQGWPGIVEKVNNGIDSIEMSLFKLFQVPAVQNFGNQIVAEIDKIGRWVNTHKADIAEYFGGFISGALRAGQGLMVFASAGIKAIAFFQQATGRALGTVLAGLSNFGSVAGGIIKHVPGLEGFGNALEAGSKQGRKFADEMWNSGAGLTRIGDELFRGSKTLGGWANGADRITDSLTRTLRITDAVGQEITTLPNGTLTIKDNTPEVQQRLKAIGFEVQKLPDGSFAVVPKTDEAKRIMDAYRSAEAQNPITPPVQPNLAPAQQSMQQFFDQWKNSLISPHVQVTPPEVPSILGPPGAPGLPPIPQPRAHGGLFRGMANFAGGKLPERAMIQSAMGRHGLVQWAEDSTRGEAFIPLAGGRRSVDIWAQTGRLLGVFDEGGIRGYGNLYREAAALHGGAYVWGDTDCSGAVSKLVNAAVGGGGRMSTATAAAWLAQRGFQFGLGPPGTLRIGWKNGGPGGGHMAATLPDGTHFESGGSHGGILMGGGAAGAEDKQFTEHAYLPMQGLYPDGPAGGGGGFSGLGFGSGGGAGGGGGFGGSGGGGGGGGGYGGGAGGSGGGGAGGGYYSAPDPARVRDAEQRVTRADQRVSELEQRQRELKANASQSERMRLEHELANARQEAQDARQDLDTTRQGKFHPGRGGGAGGGGLGGGATQLGVGLDQDFGMSQGLPGLAKNLVSFLGNLALAPALGALTAVSQFGGATSGAGLLGMFGGGGAAAGGGYGGYSSPGYTPGYSSTGYGTPGGLNSAGLGPDAAAALAARGPGGAGGVGGAGASPMGIGGAPGTTGALGPGGVGAAPGAGDPGMGGPGGAAGMGTGLAPFGRGGPPAAGPFGGGMGGLPGIGRPNSVFGGRQMEGSKGTGIGFGGGLIGMAQSAVPSAMSMAGTAGAATGVGAGAAPAMQMAAAAAQIGIDEMNRAVAFGAQAASIGVSGLLETFSLNDSPLADPGKSWLGRLVVGASGARPAVANMAGMLSPQPQQGMMGDGQTPPAPDGQGVKTADPQGGDGKGGVTINYTNNSPIATEDRAAKDIARHQVAASQMPGTR
ncbi:phage tail tape measure protein [Mycobacterium kubicae]|uniref:phage tail tape measure protein n=1 Tax=Mycobacterium kubicae TaxID=120959 RepID=UPI00164205F4|nr:phage tail tape measure protein [Mycobacterium kubicae]QNI06496.1 phage tail tape measure protein [Mycobacterium kubicae]